MSDKENVIKHFEHLLNAAKGNYQDFVDLTVDAGEEILSLLKEQEAEPVEVCGQMFTIKYGHCPKCGEGLNSEVYPHWCGFCGQAVVWNDV